MDIEKNGRVANDFATRPKAFNPSRKGHRTRPIGAISPGKGRISCAVGAFQENEFHWAYCILQQAQFALVESTPKETLFKHHRFP